MNKLLGVAAAVIVSLPLLASPAQADVVGYEGIVRASDGTPIAGAQLAVYPSEADTPGAPAATFTADADGHYLINGLDTSKTYKIETSAPGYRPQWWYRAPDFYNATALWIPSNAVVAEDVTLGTGAGSITGRITDQSGAPADVIVTVSSVDDSFQAGASTSTLGDGRYRIDNLPPGQYKVSFYDNDHGTQWIRGKESAEEATVFTVADGQTVTADDSWLPLGSVRVVVGDADTGKSVARPCVSVFSTPHEVQACGKNGVVVLNDVPPGYWGIQVTAGASYFVPEEEKYVTVKRGKTAKFVTTLEPGAAIKTKVVDAGTGAPLGLICVRMVEAAWPDLTAHMPEVCSSDDGTLELGPFSGAQTVNLYAYQFNNPWEPPTVRYGDQWVGGAKGGTGDQRKALKINIEPKVTKTIPAIKMDHPGTITGTVRDAQTGQPVRGICGFPYAIAAIADLGSGPHCSNAQGVYTIDDVGPYSWPVEFASPLQAGYAWQWSGNVADRYAATYVPVTAAGSVTVDAAMAKGGVLAGTVTNGGTPQENVQVKAYNFKTHDIAGPTWDYTDGQGAYSLPGYRGQQLLVNFVPDGQDCWYGSTPAAATAVRVVDAATTQLAIDTTGNCARP